MRRPLKEREPNDRVGVAGDVGTPGRRTRAPARAAANRSDRGGCRARPGFRAAGAVAARGSRDRPLLGRPDGRIRSQPHGPRPGPPRARRIRGTRARTTSLGRLLAGRPARRRVGRGRCRSGCRRCSGCRRASGGPTVLRRVPTDSRRRPAAGGSTSSATTGAARSPWQWPPPGRTWCGASSSSPRRTGRSTWCGPGTSRFWGSSRRRCSRSPAGPWFAAMFRYAWRTGRAPAGLVDGVRVRLRAPERVHAMAGYYRAAVRRRAQRQGSGEPSARAERSLVVWGTEDPPMPLRVGESVVSDLGQVNDPATVRMVTLPGVGHWPLEEVPGLVVPLVVDFLRPLTGSGAHPIRGSARRHRAVPTCGPARARRDCRFAAGSAAG